MTAAWIVFINNHCCVINCFFPMFSATNNFVALFTSRNSVQDLTAVLLHFTEIYTDIARDSHCSHQCLLQRNLSEHLRTA